MSRATNKFFIVLMCTCLGLQKVLYSSKVYMSRATQKYEIKSKVKTLQHKVEPVLKIDAIDVKTSKINKLQRN